MSKEVMRQALEALEAERDNYQDWDEKDGAPEYIYEAITALREALAAQQEAQAEGTVKERTPQERRDAGEWHCPECFTFGHQHRQGCTAAHGIKENT